MISKHSWVRIHDVVLDAGERSSQLPPETQAVPLEMWVKGFLQESASVGDTVTVKTITGRLVTGTLTESAPSWRHDFGECIQEILPIGPMVRGRLAERREKAAKEAVA